MKRRCVSGAMLTLAVFFLTACIPQPALTDNAEVVIGDSARYLYEDLEAAAESVIEDFKQLFDLELLLVKYDEELSLRYEEDLGETDNSDTIFFTIDFYANENARDGFNQDFNYMDFKYIVTRDTRESEWQANIYGYP